MIEPHYERFALMKEYSSIQFCMIDVSDSTPDFIDEYFPSSSIPQFAFFVNGQHDRSKNVRGKNVDKLKQELDDMIE